MKELLRQLDDTESEKLLYALLVMLGQRGMMTIEDARLLIALEESLDVAGEQDQALHPFGRTRRRAA